MTRGERDVVDINRDLSDTNDPALEPHRPRSGWGRRQPRKTDRGTGSARTTGVRSTRCLQVAEQWIALGEQRGVKDPANAKWLANQIYDQVNGQDKEIGQLLRKKNGLDRAHELLDKMSEVYWNEYADSRVKEYVFDFLSEEVWDDVRYYADMYLRVQRAVVRNVVIPQPVYDKRSEQEMHKALDAAKVDSWVEQQQQWIRDHPDWLDSPAPTRVSSGQLISRWKKIRARRER